MSEEEHLPGLSLKFKELQKGTENFSEKFLLGEGSFGKVFKGVIPDPREQKSLFSSNKNITKIEVAVKKLNPSSFQGYKEWLAEIKLLTQLHHPNLVRLIGYCHEKGDYLLVYELCHRGSLETVLFGGNTLTWNMRVDIAYGTAKGLKYLHDNNVIHRDLKSSNILIAEDFSARLTDFGLAKSGPSGDKTHVSTRVLGTLGYLDPAYMETGRLTKKSDTYSFGVLMLELLTGKPSMNEDGSLALTTFMKPVLAEKRPNLRYFIDPRLHDAYSRPGAMKMSILARYCLLEDAEKRPEMDVLVENLSKIDKFDPQGSGKAS